jgi:type IV secretory pathway VirJ component
VAVVGLNTLQYFWTPRTPEGAAKDLERILRDSLAREPGKQALLIGYSLGADVLPFMAGRLPADLRAQIAAIALLGPGRSVSFEFHLSDWLGGESPGALPVAPELAKMAGMKVLCFYGEEEEESLCRDVPSKETLDKIFPLGGGHHFGGEYEKAVDLILAETSAP